MKNKILISVFLMLMPSFSGALTLSQIRDQIRIRAKDTLPARQRYTNAQIDAMVNQTAQDVANISWIIKKSTDIELISGSTFYTLPTDLIEFHRVTFNNKNLPETSLQSLDARFNNGAWPNSGGIPSSYFQSPSMPNSIGVYPYPNSTSSTGTLSIMYFASPVTLSEDTDVPFNSLDRYSQFHDLLIYEPCYKIFLIEGDLESAASYKSYYEARLQILLGSVAQRPNYLPGFSSQRQ